MGQCMANMNTDKVLAKAKIIKPAKSRTPKYRAWVFLLEAPEGEPVSVEAI